MAETEVFAADDFVISDGVLTKYNGTADDVVIPNSVTVIGSEAFSGNTHVETVTVPSGVTSIGSKAFYNCTNLLNINLPDTLTTIGKSAFEECISLTGITIPDSVTSMGNRAFYDCVNLNSLKLSAGLTVIGAYCFYNNNCLSTLIIPNNVSIIQQYAFYKCEMLGKVYLPENLASIGQYAFYHAGYHSSFNSANHNSKCNVYKQINNKYEFSYTFSFSYSETYGNYSHVFGGDYFYYSITDVYYAGDRTLSNAIIDGSSNGPIFNPQNMYLGSSQDDALYNTGNNETEDSSTQPYGFYYDNQYKKPVEDEIELYANGGKTSTPQGIINTSQQILYTNIPATYQHKSAGDGRGKTGKVVVGITTSNEKPDAYNGKITDTTAKNIATASISNGVIKIKANKEPGTVYLHVIDTGDRNVYASCKIIVNVLPTDLKLYSYDNDAGDYVETKKVTVNVEEELTLIAKMFYKSGAGQLKQMDDFDLNDTDMWDVSLDGKSQGLLDVDLCTLDEGKGYQHIRITPKALRSSKKINATLTITCLMNKKKTKIKLTVVNDTASISAAGTTNAGKAQFGMVTGIVTGSAIETGIVSPGAVTVSKEADAEDCGEYALVVSSDMLKEDGTLNTALTAEIKISVLGVATGSAITDKGKIFAMATLDSYDLGKFEKGKFSVTTRPDKSQNKIKCKLSRDYRTVTVKFAKGTPMGVTSYFTIFFNNTGSNGGGYKQFSITTYAEATPTPEPAPNPSSRWGIRR